MDDYLWTVHVVRVCFAGFLPFSTCCFLKDIILTQTVWVSCPYTCFLGAESIFAQMLPIWERGPLPLCREFWLGILVKNVWDVTPFPPYCPRCSVGFSSCVHVHGTAHLRDSEALQTCNEKWRRSGSVSNTDCVSKWVEWHGKVSTCLFSGGARRTRHRSCTSSVSWQKHRR